MNRRTRTILRNVAVAPIVIPVRMPCVLLMLLGRACLSLSGVLLRFMRRSERANEWLDMHAPGFVPVPRKCPPDITKSPLAKSFGTDAYNGPFTD